MAQRTVAQESDPLEKASNGLYGPAIRRSWLIHRLQVPMQREGKEPVKAVNPFTFGAGSSGLSKDAINAISPIFRFDYMGAAEYEMGVNGQHPPVAVALHAIAKYTSAGNGVAGTIRLGKEEEAYYICSKEQRAYVEELIKYLYYNENGRGKRSRVRDSVGIRRTLRYDKPEYVRLRGGTIFDKETFEKAKEYLPMGWLELDNGFLFFANKEMFEKSRILFKI